MRILPTMIAVVSLVAGVGAQGTDLSKLRPTSDTIPVARFHSAALQDVLRLIADAHGLRVEFAPDVDVHQQVHNVILTNAKVTDALRLILDAAQVSAVVVNETTLRVVRKP